MSKKQNSEGGFSSWGTKNSESCVQIIVALCELGIPLDAPRFVKKRKHAPGQSDDLLSARKRVPAHGRRLRLQSDGIGAGVLWPYCRPAASGRQKQPLPDERCPNHPRRTGDRSCQRSGIGGKIRQSIPALSLRWAKHSMTLPGSMPIKNQPAIEALAARGVIDGKSDGSFDPEGA